MPDAIAFPVRDILARARLYLPDMSAFLRDLIRIPSPSCHEEAVVRRIIAEMEKLGYTAEIDGMGNALGWLGSGSRLFAYDAHIDTVSPGTLANWSFDPYAGFEDEHCIGGLGASDQSGGMASMLYGGKIMADLGLRPESVSILMAGTVQEEDCDGLCWQYLIRDFLAARGMRPEAAVSTEPTDGGICRGHRGRMEIRVEIRGRSCHGSAPERGENAIFAMGRVLPELEQLAGQLGDDPFLGKGSLTVSEIFFSSPSRCAVADGCAVSIDRRLTAGEDAELALNQIRNLPAVRSGRQGGGKPVPLRQGFLDGPALSCGLLFSRVEHSGGTFPVPGIPGMLEGTLPRRNAPAGQMDFFHQCHGHCGHVRHTGHRLRPGAGSSGTQPGRTDMEGGSRSLRGVLCRPARRVGIRADGRTARSALGRVPGRTVS